ncbi:MAG TPA: DUF4235 domain-containing protein [Acidimicrobiales bacterium]|jgi:hypothetical protein|nr:DUF4235 domain-containing protein [Acidimicrobiales bacterium]
MAKVVYRPLALLTTALGGLMASWLFRSVWKVVADEDEAPKSTDRDRSWREVLTAAALEGAVFGLVKATVDRAGAKSFEKATGTWPGDD